MNKKNEYIFDLTDLEIPNDKRDFYTEWGDHPARTRIEEIFLNNAGKKIKVKITRFSPRSVNKEVTKD